MGPPCRRCPLTRAPPYEDPWAPPVLPIPQPSTRTPRTPPAPTTQSEATPSPPQPFLAARTPTHFPLPRSHPLQSCRTHLTSRTSQRSTVIVRHDRVPILSPLLRSRRAHCLGEFQLRIRNLRRASIYPHPLWFSLPTLTGPSSCSQSTAAVDPRPRRAPTTVQGYVPESSFEVTSLPLPLIFPLLPSGVRNCSPE
jgi:hypothetical protein